MSQIDALWCCHFRGPDDFYAAESYEAAKEQADAINAVFDKDRPLLDDILCRAVPALWPWSAEAHAANLARGRG